MGTYVGFCDSIAVGGWGSGARVGGEAVGISGWGLLAYGGEGVGESC
jgi:hypothetical protein